MEQLKIGDKVYWKQMIGFNVYNLSGTIELIEGDIITVHQYTQNTNKIVKKHINTLTKTKRQ
jgi:hypothetical protein